VTRAACLLVALVLAGCGGDEASAPPQDTTVEGGCRDVAAPEPQPEGTLQPPSNPLAAGVEQRVRVETSCGTFTITLDPRSAPQAAASFAELATIGFFDGTSFHRVVPGFVIQGGDPTGTGGGGPGYTTVDPPPATTTYPRGTVAMAKGPVDPPGTAGSQFFVVTGAGAGLTPDYALLGRVAKGMEVVQEIGRLGDPASGAGTPLQSVAIEETIVRER
jgi:peptidyl-prolyl cis-trans isomerase B (cyclophilin B)